MSGLAGTSRPSIRTCTGSSITGIQWCPEPLLSSPHLPGGARLLFNGHPSQAFLKQALTYRRAAVWKGSLAPALGQDWIVAGLIPVQKFHSLSPVVKYFLTLWISKNVLLSPGNLKNWCFFKTGALYSKIKIES